jgi:dihydropteroate synthase
LYLIKTRNLVLDENKIYVMGVLNVTPDSFSDAGEFLDAGKALDEAIKIQSQGASILDIGAQSTRPGFKMVDEKTEWKRLKVPLDLIRQKLRIPISVDTFHPYVALRSIDSGADIINDVTGFKNREMVKILARSSASLIVMHDGPLSETRGFLQSKFDELTKNSQDLVEKERLCFDPGIGFGKSQEENLAIIKNPLKFSVRESFTLVGVSRKRVTSLACQKGALPKERLVPTIASNAVMAVNGAQIIRVHDVKEGVECAKMSQAIKFCNCAQIKKQKKF